MSPAPMSLTLSVLSSSRLGSPSICPTCAFAQAIPYLTGARKHKPARSRNSYSPRKQRYASTLASSTAVNASKEIPSNLRALYVALESLTKNASNHVNLSRLQLALRSLESTKPTIRVAVLGLHGQKTARQLTRLLLADPLSEQGDWEKRLVALGEGERRALLLRYGDEADVSPSNSQVVTLHVPSRILQRNNLEILVSSLNISSDTPVGNADAEQLQRAALVPMAETPNSFTGGVSLLTFPVHRAILVGDGLQGCMRLGSYAISDESENENRNAMIQLASDFPELSKNTDRDAPVTSSVSILDVLLAEGAITKFRESTSNASIYEQQWNESGVPLVSQWLWKAFDAKDEISIDPAVRALIDDVANEVSKNIATEEETKSQRLPQPTTIEQARQPLNESLKVWAMRAHLELRDQLDIAFSSEKWAKLRWWKLFWRVDDVPMIMNELVERSWLVEAEKGIIWLSGRSAEAGLHDETHMLKLRPPSTVMDSQHGRNPGDVDRTVLQRADATAGDSTSGNQISTPNLPWPVQISLARGALQATTIPTLQSLAQALLLQTASVTALASALSALVYVAFPASTLYSSAAIAAVGLAWSLRHLQRTWEAARSSWEGQAKESGRVVLKEVEEGFRKVLRTSTPGSNPDDALDAQDSQLAKEAVKHVKSALGEFAPPTAA